MYLRLSVEIHDICNGGEFRVDLLVDIDHRAIADVNSNFFFYLTGKRLLRRFALIDLTADTRPRAGG
jgi:hypothetical protein